MFGSLPFGANAFADSGAAPPAQTLTPSLFTNTNTFFSPTMLGNIIDNGSTTITIASGGFYNVQRTTGGGAWTAGAVSTNYSIGDCVAIIKASQTNLNFAVGLNTDPLTDNNYTSVDSLIHFQTTGLMAAYENGTPATVFTGSTAYTTSDYIFIRRIGTTIDVLKGATSDISLASVIGTFPTAVSGNLYFDSSVYDSNAAFDAMFKVPALVSPALFANANSFLTPTVSPGPVTLTPSLVTDGDTFFTPVVASLNTLSPSLYSDGDTFFTPTVTASKTLSPTLFVDGDTFFAPTVTSLKTLSPALFSDSDTFFGPTVGASYTLTPALFTDGDTFYTPTVSQSAGSQTLTPLLFVNSSSIFAPTVQATYQLTPALYANGQSFYGPTVTPGTVTLLATLYVDPDVFYAPQVLSTAGGGGPARPRVSVVFF